MKEVLNALFDNIGGKIKALAKTIFIIESIASVIFGLYLMSVEDEPWWWGMCILIIICGPIVALISAWPMYAFGELVDSSVSSRNLLEKINKKENKPVAQTIEKEELPEI